MNTTSIIIDKERQPPWASPGAVVFSCNDEIVGPGGQHDWWQLCQHGWPLYLDGYSAIILLDKLEFAKTTYLFVNAVQKPTVDTFPSVDGGIATERNAKI